MINTTRTLATLPVCTTMALLASPALAHDGMHQMTWLQSLLHELAHAGTLPAVLAIAACGAAAAWGLSKRKAAAKKL
jgi:hypothetical protein